MKLTTFIRSALLVVALAGGLAACKPDNNSSSNNQSTPAQTQTQSGQPASPNADPRMTDSSIQGEISTARNFYFVFDGSGSMSGSKIREAKAAVKTFIGTVPSENVNLGLYVFDTNGSREVVPLAPNNRAAFLAAVDRVSDGGGTPLGASIEQGVKSLNVQYQKQLGYGEFRLIVVTDGESSDSITTGVREAQRLAVPLYTIGFDMGTTHELRKYSVSYQSANNGKELTKALEQAASELDVYDPADFQQK